MARGFSLPELTLVLLVAGVVAALAAARWDGGRGIDEFGFAQSAAGTLRLAQRRALADGCEVRVQVTAAALEISRRAALCSGAFDRAVPGASGEGSVLSAVAPAGVALTASPALFYFDTDGRVLDAPGGSPVDVALGVGPRTVTLIGTTGHVGF